MRFRTLLQLAVLLTSLGLVAASSISSVPPESRTDGAIKETQMRIRKYMLEHQDYPPSLDVLPKREGYANRTTDCWGRPLIYSVSEDGIVTLASLGRDGVEGGTGDDTDFDKRFRIRNEDGSLNIHDRFWSVTSEIKSDR